MIECQEASRSAALSDRRLAIAGSALLALCGALLAMRWVGLDWAVHALARWASFRAPLSPESYSSVSVLIAGAAALAGASSALLLAHAAPRTRAILGAIIRWDALGRTGVRVPDPYRALTGSSVLALTVIALWLVGERVGGLPRTLFAQEGFFEAVTFVLDATAAALCAAAAFVWRHRALAPRAAPLLFAGCAVLLLVVAMEEISWGQTLFGFEAPRAWAAIAHGGETSLHGLVDASVTAAAWRAVALAFGAGIVLLTAAAVRAPRSLAGAIAPPPSLLPLALAAAFAGIRLHGEVAELLLAVFFAFYGYRLFVATQSGRRVGPAAGENASADASGRRAELAALRLGLRIAIPVVLIIVLLSRFNWAQAAQELSRVSPWAVLGLFGVMLLELPISTMKWSHALRMHDLLYRFSFLLRALCCGFFLNSFLPTAVGGDVYRVYKTLPRDGFRFRALSAVLVERAVGLLSLLTLGGIGALLIADRFQIARAYCLLMLGASVVGILGIVAIERGWLRWIVRRWESYAVLHAVARSISLLGNRGRDWLALVGWSVLYQAMSVAVVFALFSLLSAEATLAQSAMITAMVGVAAVLPVSINGIGVMEGAIVAGAVMLGIDYDKALLVAFLRRFLNLSLAASCGLVYAATLGRDGPHEGLRQPLAALARRAGWRPKTAAPPVAPARSPVAAPAAPADVPLADVPLAVEASGARSASPYVSSELLEYTHDAIMIWEMGGGGIRYFNRAAEALYGYGREQALGRVTHELLRTELTGGVGALEDTLARYGVWVGELRHTTRDGREVLVEARLALLSQHNGRWLVLEVNRDISDCKAAETARLEMVRQLAALRSRTDC